MGTKCSNRSSQPDLDPIDWDESILSHLVPHQGGVEVIDLGDDADAHDWFEAWSKYRDTQDVRPDWASTANSVLEV